MNSKKNEKITESVFTYEGPRKNEMGSSAYSNKLE